MLFKLNLYVDGDKITYFDFQLYLAGRNLDLMSVTQDASRHNLS